VTVTAGIASFAAGGIAAAIVAAAAVAVALHELLALGRRPGHSRCPGLAGTPRGASWTAPGDPMVKARTR
jgi:hypothetical protein